MYKLHIQNFQIISNAEIHFQKGLTLITGRSNNGKSSIFKAFKQLTYNQSGTDYIKHGATKCTIQLETPDGHKIVYSKPKQGGAQYNLDSLPPLQKVGSSQPPQITQLIHINKDLNYNFWNQLDKPFLISQSPKEQFDLLQQSPHTQTIQNVLHTITQDHKHLQHSITQTQAQIELLQQQNKSHESQLTNLPKFSRLFHSINDLKSTKDHLFNLQNQLHKYQQIDLHSLHTQLQTFSNLPNTDHLQSQFDTLQFFQHTLQSLIQTHTPINEFQNQIQQITQQIDRTKLFIKQQFPLCPLCNRPFATPTHLDTQIHNSFYTQ